jgi:hypothetical protein
MLPPHIAEHSRRDLESGCVDSALALARRMLGIRVERERRSFDVGFLFRIKGRSCPNTRAHERPDYTSCAAQSHVSEQTEHFSGVVGLIVVKLQVNYLQCRIGVMN